MKSMVKMFALAALLAVVSVPARSQDLMSYLQKHASFVGGVVIVDSEKEKLVEFRVVDDFPLFEKVRGVARVGLFSITRDGEVSPDPGIPSTVEQAKAYSDGEVWFAAYRPLATGVSLECLTGVTFKMISVTGQVGNPLDGTKVAAACGPRFDKNGYELSIVGGHFGPVAEPGKVVGFVPSVMAHAYIPLAFLGKSTAFVPDLAFGRNDDGTFSRTLRLGIATRF